MERAAKLCLCLAGGLVLNTGLRADDLVSADNPYASIVSRNVFDIHPPPPVDPNAQPAEPPPKITPNGIVSTFGHLQVLFKVAIPAKPGVPAKDQSYILSEGQAQDDIEVTKINEPNGVVTFNNHGTVQELPLVVGTASGPTGPAPGGPAPGPGPNLARPGFAPVGGNAGNAGFGGGGGSVIPFGNRFGQSGGFGGQNPKFGGGGPTGFGGMNSGISGGANIGSSFGVAANNGGFSAQFGGTTTAGGASSQSGAATANTGTINYPALNGMTPEEVQALIAAQHAAAVQAGSPWAGLFPPTRFDSQAGIPPSSTAGSSTTR